MPRALVALARAAAACWTGAQRSPGLVCGAPAGPRTRGKAGREATCQLLAATVVHQREALRLRSQTRTCTSGLQVSPPPGGAGTVAAGGREAAAGAGAGGPRGPGLLRFCAARTCRCPASREPGRQTSFHSGAAGRAASASRRRLRGCGPSGRTPRRAGAPKARPVSGGG